MLFWIFVICLVTGIALYIWSVYDYDDVKEFVGQLLIVIGALTMLTSLMVLSINHCCIFDSDIATRQQTYESLVYQYENDIFENDNDVGKYELLRDIREWNENLAADKAIQRNFWVGIYVPNIYDQFDFIELDKGEEK